MWYFLFSSVLRIKGRISISLSDEVDQEGPGVTVFRECVYEE
jgi:hypothetical protein